MMPPPISVVANEDECARHDPAYENIFGAKGTYREAPRRLTDLLRLFRSHTQLYRIVESDDHGFDAVLTCHDPGYVDWLRTCYEEWIANGGSADGVVSRIALHPHFLVANGGAKIDPATLSLDGRTGLYSWDLGHTVARDTFRSAYASAQVAVSAADWLLNSASGHPAPSVFAATRPPGHHAGSACTGGYCYLNNAAIAARRLQRGSTSTRVAILDLDAHFGNGTAEIFASDPTVLNVSLHADKTFPHFGGRADETGSGPGEGLTRNFPLPVGTSESDYLAALEQAIGHVTDFRPAYLVVSLGVDTYEHDPFQLFKVSKGGYGKMGSRLAQLGLPTCIIMEGGYNLDDLPELFHAFLSSFGQERSD